MLDRQITDRLDEERLAGARRSQEQDVAGFADEAAGGQVEDLLAWDRRVERPVEVIERLEFAELGPLHTAFDLSLIADQQLVLQDQLQELGMAQLVTGRFLQPDVQGFGQPRQAQLTQGGL